MHVRVCTDCGEEYRPGVERCADCGGALEDRWDTADSPRTEAAAANDPDTADADAQASPVSLPPRDALRTLTMAERASELDALARDLAAHRIPFAVEAGQQSFALMVGEADLEVAAERLVALTGEPAADDVSNPKQCPACGSQVPEGAGECPDCGLGLGG